MKIKEYHYFVLFFIGVCLIIWEIKLYRNSIIELYIPLTIILTIGSIGSLLDNKRFFKWYGKNLKTVFYIVCQNFVSWGFIGCTIFMAVNYYFTDEILLENKYQIIKRSSMTGGRGNRSNRKPLITVDYNGSEKELVFPNDYFSTMEEYNTVKLIEKKGFFGFNILIDQSLEK